MNLSKRARLTPSSPIRKLVPFAEKAKKQGVKIYHLNIGQPDIKSPPGYLKALHTYSDQIVAYENSLGNLKLRKALVNYYKKNKIEVNSENIIITSGASEAILFSLMATCNPGDNCLVFEPLYANYLSFAAMTDIKLQAIKTSPKTGFHLPKKSVILKKISKKTKAIIICNPNNPTGTVYSKGELTVIVEIAKVHNLTIISDETYREFVYDNKKHHSFLSLSKKPQNVILIDSFSKRYSLCGARLGCFVSLDQQIIGSVTKFAQSRLSASTVAQKAGIEALKTPESYLKKIVHEYKQRRNTLISELNSIPGVFVKKPEGAFYAVVELPVTNAEDFAKWLLTDFRYKNQTVMLAPAAGFYLAKNMGKNQVRIAYVLNTADLKKAITILHQAISVYPN